MEGVTNTDTQDVPQPETRKHPQHVEDFLDLRRKANTPNTNRKDTKAADDLNAYVASLPPEQRADVERLQQEEVTANITSNKGIMRRAVAGVIGFAGTTVNAATNAVSGVVTTATTQGVRIASHTLEKAGDFAGSATEHVTHGMRRVAAGFKRGMNKAA